jgi:hypothetical protein
VRQDFRIRDFCHEVRVEKVLDDWQSGSLGKEAQQENSASTSN